MHARTLTRPPLGRIRLAEVDDAPLIMQLVNEPTAQTFRITVVSDIVYLIENCVLSICQLSLDGKVMGFLAAKDSVPIPSVHPSAWEEYIWSKYKAVELNSRNTLFIHLLCWNPLYARELVDNLLRSIFMHDPYIQFIAMVKSVVSFPQLVPGQSRSEASFRRVQAMERGVPGDYLPALCLAERKEVCPRLRIRRAVEEDNDDLVPIIERHSTRMRELYGDYYISELISRHPESERVLLVCEHKELAVGLMVLNTEINFESLEECFDLSPFSGFRHLDYKVQKQCNKDMDSTTSFTTESGFNQNSDPTIQQSYMDPKDMKSRVTWLFDEDDFHEARKTIAQPRQGSDVSDYSHLVIIDLFEDDEDEVEFDIVNIDPELLRFPSLISPSDNIFKNILDGRHKDKDDKALADEMAKKSQKKPTLTIPTYKLLEPIIRYNGAPNAFLLEVFSIHDAYDERFGFDILEVAFELFPNREYCLMCLPSNHTAFPLLDHFTLVTPHYTRMRFINETLYVAHVNSVRGDVSVRLGEECDLASLGDILEHAPRKDALVDLFETTLHSPMIDSYMLLSQNQPIGMVIIGPLEESTSIRTQYDLEPEPRRPGTDATILAGVMSPVMEPHGRWYLRDIMRQSQYSTLFWICQPVAKGEASPSRNMMSLAEKMMPVRPRRSVPNISGSKKLDKIFKDVVSPFALWMIERPLSALPKGYVNNSIVVVGASRTGLAFLEALVMGPTAKYLTFSNVTLVSEHGIPMVAECLKAAHTCVPHDGRYTDRYLKSIPFYFYIDVMHATMINIDRDKKCIHLKGGGIKFYDELVLTCGQQFQHPDYLKESLEHAKEIKKGKPCERILMDNPKYRPDRVPCPPDLPENVILINSVFQANICLRKLLRMINEDKGALSEDNQIVVYGECIEAYCCIAALLELGIAPAEILFVEPFPPDDHSVSRVNCFNDETVDARVQLSLESLGVRALRRCRLASWCARGGRVLALRLMTPLHCLHVPCFALFYYGLKAIDLYAFKAINESGLVYDGGLVVGPTFASNDPHVFGAGAGARYSRRLRAARRLHRHYSSEDVGEALAQLFLRKLDPYVSTHPDLGPCPSDVFPEYDSPLTPGSHTSIPTASYIAITPPNRRWNPVPRFTSPIVQSATLPGPLYYLKLRKPGPEFPMEVQLTLPHKGHILETDKRGNYFRLSINVLHCVDAVSCLSKKPFSKEILSQLYGKHEAFFNMLLARFQLDQIDDFYEFFTQPWMAVLYQETFEDLINHINLQDVGSVFDLLKSTFEMLGEQGSKGARSAAAVARSPSTASCSEQECGYGPQDAKKLGTFRSVLNKYVARGSSLLDDIPHPTVIPSECGQSEAIRDEASGFWRAVGGERIVQAHVARCLARHAVTNPHYAPPRPAHNIPYPDDM